MLKMIIAAAIAISVAVIPVQTEAAVKSPFKDVSENNPYYEIVHEMRDKQYYQWVRKRGIQTD